MKALALLLTFGLSLTSSASTPEILRDLPSHLEIISYDSLSVTLMNKNTFDARVTLVGSRNDTVAGTIYYDTYTSSPYIDTTTYLDCIIFDPDTILTNGEMYTFGLISGVTDLKGYTMRDSFDLQFVIRP